MNDVVRSYTRYAIVLLLLTLLAGVYLRATFAGVDVRTGLTGANVVHAHSHVGFFGWAVMAAFAVILTRATAARSSLRSVQHALAHLIGTGAAVAFVGFALRGYDAVTITVSAFHVLFWVVFATLALPALRRDVTTPARFFRAALCFLVIAGIATIAPVVMMVRGVTDPWLLQLGVKLFLTPFVSGFLLLTALGAIYQRLRAPRFAGATLVLLSVGTLPATLLYVAAAPPAPWLLWLGRAGTALVGAGVLLFATDALRDASLPPLARLVAGAAALKGSLELVVATGVGSGIMHNRPITIAFLHLVLLGIVTPAFALALRPALVARARSTAFVTGLALMCAALVSLGWPWAARQLVLLGLPLTVLHQLAFAGGAGAAVALVLLLVGGGNEATDVDGNEGTEDHDHDHDHDYVLAAGIQT